MTGCCGYSAIQNAHQPQPCRPSRHHLMRDGAQHDQVYLRLLMLFLYLMREPTHWIEVSFTVLSKFVIAFQMLWLETSATMGSKPSRVKRTNTDHLWEGSHMLLHKLSQRGPGWQCLVSGRTRWAGQEWSLSKFHYHRQKQARREELQTRLKHKRMRPHFTQHFVSECTVTGEQRGQPDGISLVALCTGCLPI
ncbi:uncharacterized protein LOC132402627 isoform X3 [Hypanus sabinus]|uniref:uncharacterized protein LOC132402627 isoform X3 n=1 Tax=Hypanus sabinus TaxID=79690 RepID=UPI0028C452B6|nr:uncharacterized protein LOC132402627 isoform X3 [Hypanus sabinus]